MSTRNKWILAAALIACGLALILWNLRDPNRAYLEPPKEKHVISLEQLPLPAQAAIKQASAGGKIEGIEQEKQGNTTTYKADIIVGGKKTELRIAEDGSVIKTKSKRAKPASMN
jgi:hypothetical protein